MIEVNMSHEMWLVKRRYSDFLAVYKSIAQHYPGFRFEFPPKRTFGNFERAVIEERKTKLNGYVSRRLNDINALKIPRNDLEQCACA